MLSILNHSHKFTIYYILVICSSSSSSSSSFPRTSGCISEWGSSESPDGTWRLGKTLPSSSSSRQSCSEIIKQTGPTQSQARSISNHTHWAPNSPLSEGGVLTELAEHDLTEGSNAAAVTLIITIVEIRQDGWYYYICQTWAMLMKNVCSLVKLTPGILSSLSMLASSLLLIISRAWISQRFSSNVKSPSTWSRTVWSP